MADRAVQTESEAIPAMSKPSKASPLKRTANKAATTNGQSHTPVHPTNTVHAGPSTSTAKRKRNVNGALPSVPSTRELRPRSRHMDSMASVSSKDSSNLDSPSYDPFISTPSKSTVLVKMEEHESPVPSSSKTTSRANGRPVRRPSQKGSEKEDQPKRGRKRKEREDDLSEDNDRDRNEAVEQLKKSRTEKEAREKAVKGKEREKEKKTLPSPAKTLSTASSTSGPSSAPGPTTPSLKIRLPRLSDIASHTSSPQAAKFVDTAGKS
ncbi:hypothetical protein B0H10DRAFT_1251274 [Mycena sp. CBHHK59/15]|nr:hypothetical protein B0H10DRAFT_1251274 [Mycena sp. CBHHK59/15]